MKNPPLVLLQAIRKALQAKQATGDDVDAGHAHAGLYHDGFSGTIQPPIIPALNNQGGVGKQRWDTGVVDVVIPLYNFYAQGDNVVLYVDDAYVDDQTVRDTNVNLVFAAPVGAFNPSPATPDYQADVHYHTIDQLGGNETASHATRLPVKLTVPGNPREDLPPGTVVNDRLAAPVGVPSEIIPLPGVDIPVLIPAYAHMHTGDIVTLSWAGASIVYPPLTADQVGNSVTFSVPYDLLAARPGAAREVRYWIRDRVQNYSLFSPSVYSDVAEQATLTAPILIGQSGPGFDVDTLNGGPVLVLIPITDLLPGDRVKVHFTGQPLDWPYLHHITEEQTFSGSSLTFSVPNPLARTLVASTLNLYYQVQRGANTLRSHSLVLPLTGTDLSLPAPQIPSAAGGEVAPPAGAIDIEIVVFANSAFTVGSVVEIVWRGINGGGDDHLHSQSQPIVNAGAAVLFRAPIGWVNEIAGGALEVTYNLRVGGQTYTSQTLRHNVAGEASLLPAPEFDPALNELDQLDVDSLTGAFHTLVDISNPAFAGGTARLAWTGSSAADVIEISPIPNGPTTLRFPIDRARLIDPNLDQNVVVSYQILRADGRVARSRSVLLSVVDSSTSPWPVAEVIDASGVAITQLNPSHPAGTGWQDNTATVRVRDRRLRPGDVVRVIWTLANGDVVTVPVGEAQSGIAEIVIPIPVLAWSINQQVAVSYVAIISGVPAPVPQPLALQVLSIPEPTLSPPEILEADSDKLDLGTFSGNATLSMQEYRWMVVGQRYQWAIESTLSNGGSWQMISEHYVEPADLIQGFRFPVDRTVLLRLQDGAHLRTTFRAWHSRRADDATLNIGRTYTLVQSSLEMQPPLVEGLSAGEVVVLGSSGTQRITARYTPVEEHQQVQAIWELPGWGTAVMPAQPRPMPGSLEFDFPKSWLARADGATTQIRYEVARTRGGVIQPSPAVTAKVIWWPDPQLENWSTEAARVIAPYSNVEFRYFTARLAYSVSGRIGNPAVSGIPWALTLQDEGTMTLVFHKPVKRFTLKVDDALHNPTNRHLTYYLTDGSRHLTSYRVPAVVSSNPHGDLRITELHIASINDTPLVVDDVNLIYF